jgi:tripartite-type tricarboxylate transporter receptor subunit TctC
LRAERTAKIAAAQIDRGGTMPNWTTVLLAVLLLAEADAGAHAQTYPSATVKLIVPVPAGGVTDTMARIVAQRLTEAWGQPVVVDNRPGGNYAVGAQAVAKSPPDGLTLLVAPDSTVTANPHLFSKLPYDPVKDLTPIIVLCRITPVLVINPSLAVRSVPELIARSYRSSAARLPPGRSRRRRSKRGRRCSDFSAARQRLTIRRQRPPSAEA